MGAASEVPHEKTTPSVVHVALGTPDVKTIDDGRVSHRASTFGVDRRVMTTFAVAALCYFNVSGGPIGSEPVFASGGPAMGLIALSVFPFMWCLPISLITAELSTTFPENGGFTVWVFHAFGPFWAFQEGFWFWLAGAVDNALYPALAVTCISKYAPSLATGTASWFVKAAFASVFALPNALGVQLVGRGMIFLSVLVILPFVVLTIWGFAVGDNWSMLGDFRHTDTASSTDSVVLTGAIEIDWTTLATTVFWNCNGFQNVSTFAGEVSNPGKTYPRALLMTVIAVLLTYLLPLSAAAVYNDPLWPTWTEISFSDIAHSLGGDFLLTLVTMSTLASNWGQYSSEMFCVSFQLTGMAESGLAPAVFATRAAKTDVPYLSVALSYVIVLVLTGFDLQEIMAMTNVISSLSQVLIIAAAIKLRVSKPDVHRPYRVPGGLATLVAISVVPVIVSGYLIYSTFSDGGAATIYLVPIVLVVGVVYAFAMKLTPKHFIDPKAALRDEC
ncbi:Aste57867_12782 [Aphanomyces stellatus]|uniref:Aste57867_12782 protein n=1 Tax=Aphanomyces stellatus TaxID=120398 RepID=A0A485KXA0_9STRA|nr:hypothetical protein As57867_012734 [Aphanomyces stellatus]VFT89631.1 Aste57867_12782 [Aphanomyces stellatus]